MDRYGLGGASGDRHRGAELERARVRLEAACAELLERARRDGGDAEALASLVDAEQRLRAVRRQLESAVTGARRRESAGIDGYRRGARHRYEEDDFDPRIPERANRRNGWLRDLYRDPEQAMLGGVCAGLAHYFAVEPWVARLVAISLLLFVPQLVVLGYLVAMVLMAKRPPSKRRANRQSAGGPEPAPRLAPRPLLRSVRARFTELELRLQQMEGYVTSREFRLTRELDALERDATTGSRSD